MKKVVTKKKQERLARNEKICADFALLFRKGSMKTPAYKYLSQKYGLCPLTIAKIVKGGGAA